MSRELVTGAVPCQSPGMRMPLALALSAVLALSACSDDSKDSDGPSAKEAAEAYAKTDAKKIQDESNAAIAKLESVRIEGSFGDGESTVDFALAQNKDEDCVGSVTLPGAPALEVLVVDGDRWFKAPGAFWEATMPGQADQITAVIGDRWVVADSSEFNELFTFCDFEGLVEDDGEDEATDLEVEGIEERDGEYVVEISFTQDGTEGTAYVLTDEPHYLSQVVVDGEADITYSDFDEPIGAEAPDEDDAVDLSSL